MTNTNTQTKVEWLQELASKGWIKIVKDDNRRYETLYHNGYYFDPIDNMTINDLPQSDIAFYGAPKISEQGMDLIFS